jgi:hypothetical protein
VGGVLLAGKLALEDYDAVLGFLYADKHKEEIKALDGKLTERYGVQFFWGDEVRPYTGYTVKPSNLYEANAFLHICWEEIYKYPQEVIISSAITRIETSRSIKENSKKEKERGICCGTAMNIAYEAFVGNGNEQSDARKGIHHELAHRLVLSSVFQPYIHAWEKICGTGSDLLNPDCFVDAYAMENIFEDMPSTMAALMMPDKHIELVRKLVLLKKDEAKHNAYEILSNKYALSLSIFFEASNGRMDTAYWEDLVLGRVTENYWLE